ncbi:MAG: precorrin-3B C(17)-methyltransferase [Spirochaetaceae bacterium]|jgi:precorrin-3B C17-methyltransferase|nr:precorrin-3B C(17)-methyltransferase [Spirochaetaceae bacterium]
MTLYIAGIGPGDEKYLSGEARAAIAASSVIAGYPLYLDLISGLTAGKECFSTSMRQEKERCELALSKAAAGKTTALVCSGDAVVYGMAALCLELSPRYPLVEIVVVPGITAALSGSAALGAPLTNDFAVISLSDLLTPWSIIEKRLNAAAGGGFVICLYNPSSKKRAAYLSKACEIILRCRGGETVCGIARNIGRGGEDCRILSLSELKNTEVDMFTTVFIGNDETAIINGKMVTRRGYALAAETEK